MAKEDKELETVDSSPMDYWIPKKIQQASISDFMCDPDVEFRGGKGSLTLKRNIGNSRVTIRIEKQGPFGEIRQTVMDQNVSRAVRDEMIMRLRDEGRTQQEVADIVGISQSGVSQILKRNEDKK